MKPMHFAMALLSAAMFFVLAGVFMGVQLELDGTKLVVDTAADIRWQWVFIGTGVVFLFQLLRPAFQKGLKSVSGPKFILPAMLDSDALPTPSGPINWVFSPTERAWRSICPISG
jgi:branched-chain amino acid transport system permease protein